MRLSDKRKVQRVLVMVEYDEGTMSDVFDLTALVRELAENPQSQYQQAMIKLQVDAGSDYDQERVGGRWQVKTTVCWSGMFDCKSTGDSGHLEDVINAGIQDTERVKRLRKAQERARARLEKLSHDIQQQKIEDAALIRAQYPIARVRLAPELLTTAEVEV